MFNAALATTAKAWKPPKCPSRDDWIKMCYTHKHTMEYYSATKEMKYGHLLLQDP